MSTKKPVVVESYDEVVFTEPPETGFTLPPPAPVEDESKRKRGDTKDHPLSQWLLNFSEADELLQLAAARQQVQAHIAKFRRQISLTDGAQNQQFKPL
ncbi:Transcription initiation factor TFIID subunit 14b [Hibiscus syriacus]|uniref:Transcription initiation factor TFIID subunit 14b n=1 Tax=Hibiscus syriacus TaxID=106335 RepID=A0A6A3AXQ8_HIBSY|nr:Transcription initiation factor TFIID subunit 14b [Hibiscus syriacus]